MRAATQSTYGTPDVLTTADVTRPSIADDEVLVQVQASAVTQGDRRLRAADFPGISWLPGRLMTGVLRPRHAVPGTVFAGRVVETGSAVTRFAVGDDVFGTAMHGAHAEYLAISEREGVARMPADLTYGEAAALPYGAGTALVFLRDLAKVGPGDRVLIHGASGGVGSYAVQLAHHLGAHVTGVCSRDHDHVRELGADEIVDYRHVDFTKNGQRYDVVLDTVEGNRFGTVRGSLTPRGRYLSLYMSAGLLLQMVGTALFGPRRAIAGVAMPSPAMLDDLRDLAERGAIRPQIAGRFPLDEIAAAHQFLEAGSVRGVVVVDVASSAAQQTTLTPSLTAAA